MCGQTSDTEELRTAQGAAKLWQGDSGQRAGAQGVSREKLEASISKDCHKQRLLFCTWNLIRIFAKLIILRGQGCLPSSQ